MHPLETLFRYYSTRTTEIKEYLSYYLLTRLASRREGLEDTQMRKLLAHEDPATDMGKVLSVSALIDFIFVTKGNEAYWGRTFDEYLHLVDSGDISVAMRTRLQRALLHFDTSKREWMKASAFSQHLCRFFGSWEDVIKAAGLKGLLKKQKESTHEAYRTTVRKYSTREAVVKSLRKRAAGKKSLSAKHVKLEDISLVYHARRLFGDWRSALQAAGLLESYYRENPNAVQKYPDEASVLKAIRERDASELPLLYASARESDPKLVWAALRKFGSWGEAKRQALK